MKRALIGKIVSCGLSFLLSMTTAFSQTPAQRPSFEVASIKRNVSGRAASPVAIIEGNRVLLDHATLRGLVRWAYHPAPGGPQFYAPDQLIGLPGWADTDFFDVEARAGTAAPLAQMQFMMQPILEDRFQLKAHRETREMPVYTLAVAKGGPHLKLSEDQTPTDPRPASSPSAPLPRGRTNITAKPLDAGHVLATFEGHAVSMATLANALQRNLGMEHPVVDKTGLRDQLFDFSVETTLEIPESPAGVQPGAGAVSRVRDLLFEAVQDQLGLRIDAAKGATEVFVVDSVQKPSAN